MRFKKYVESKGYFDNLYDLLNQDKSNLWYLGLYGVKRLAVPSFLGLDIESIGVKELLSVYNRMRCAGYNEEAVKRVHGAIKRILSDAEELTGDNPARYIRLSEPEPVKGGVLSPSEIKQILSLVDRSRFKNVYRLMLCSGLRLTEVLGLSDRDINWETGEISIRRMLLEPMGRPEIHYVVKENLFRDFYLSKKAFNILLDELESRDRKEYEAGYDWENPESLIFCREKGAPLRFRSITREGLLHIKSRIPQFDIGQLRDQFQYGCYEDLM